MSQDNSHLFEKPSAMATHLGIEMTDWQKGFARVEVPIAPHVANRQGIPHGGLHATLMDTAMGFAGCFTGDPDKRQMALTLSMTVNYLGQAQGTRLIAEGHVTGGGRKTYFAKADVSDDLGNLIATATGVFRYRGTPT
ncbi:PaaI family thioesterase [uncultured Roseovarius sp.]|uniref:PaaI family thioesterase n=1 Tax=uncultured Roseovarius sp. TaxID=293344 RepID=UPI0025FA3EFF|nr:PaaI family thioesterase [uncultured Roseovarius sp.]